MFTHELTGNIKTHSNGPALNWNLVLYIFRNAQWCVSYHILKKNQGSMLNVFQMHLSKQSTGQLKMWYIHNI